MEVVIARGRRHEETRSRLNTRGTLLLLLMAFPFPGETLDPSLIHLIPAVGRHFYIHEAVFFSLHESEQTLVSIQKLLSVESYSSSIVRNVSGFRSPQQRWPLCVVLFLEVETSLTFVKEVFSSSDVYSCTWLLLDPPSLSEVSLPIDSKIFTARFEGDASVVSEVYRVVQSGTRGVYKETELIVWHPEAGITATTTENLLLRRSDLSGIVIKFLTVSEPPWTYTLKNSDATMFYGYIPDIADELKACTNVTFRMKLQSDHQYGLSLPLGNWTGMVGEMLTSPEQTIGGPLSMTLERFGTIDFTYTLYNNRDIMVIRRPTNDHDAHSWKRLMSPFRCPVWIAVFSCFLVSGTFLNILAGSRRISDGLLKAAGVICGQAAPGCEGSPRPGARAASSRLLVLCLHFTAICLMASYTGQLTAFLGIKHVHVPFYGMQGLLQSEIHGLGVLGGSSSHAYFGQSSDHQLLEIYDKMVVGQQLPTSDQEGLERVCLDKSYAYFIDEESFRSIIKHLQCQFLEIPDAFLINKISLGTSKDFEYKRIINYWLMRLKSHGILSRLEWKNWPSLEEIVPEELISINIEVAAPLLAGLGMGMLVSLLVFALELQCRRIRDHYQPANSQCNSTSSTID